jgi:hypothetical protein
MKPRQVGHQFNATNLMIDSAAIPTSSCRPPGRPFGLTRRPA